jgi:hypothetical protein
MHSAVVSTVNVTDEDKMCIDWRRLENREMCSEESWRISIKQTVKQSAVCAGEPQTSIRYIVQFQDKAV